MTSSPTSPIKLNGSSTSPSIDTASSSASAQDGGDWLKCPVCREYFRDPWMLRCLHTVCSGCFDAKVEREGRNECPVCQERDVFGHMKLRPDFAARYALESCVTGERRPAPVGCTGSAGPLECARAAVTHCPTCAKYLCSGCHSGHLEVHRAHRVQTLGEARAPDGQLSTCWLHAGQPLGHYCATCEQPACQLCVDAHPAEHRRLPLDDVVHDEINVFCARVDAQKRKVVDMKKILARQMRRHCEAFERCRRLLEEHHELLVDVLPLDKDRLLQQLDERHRLQKTMLEKFGERALLLAGDVMHAVAVVERQLQLAMNADVLALKKPAESRLSAMNRKIDEHFSAEQPVAQTLMKSGAEIGRDMLRALYRAGGGHLAGSQRGSPVNHLSHHQHQQLLQPLLQQPGGGVVELGALNGFGSSTASDSSHGSSPELSLETSLSRGSSYDQEALAESRHGHMQHHHHLQQQQLHQLQQQQLVQQQMGFALPSDLSALINENGAADCFIQPFGMASNSSGASSSGSSGAGSAMNGGGPLTAGVVGGGHARLNALSHLTNGLDGLRLSGEERAPMLSVGRGLEQQQLNGIHVELNLLNEQSTAAVGRTNGGGYGNGNAAAGLGQSILSGASGVERTFNNTSFDSGFSGRYSPYSGMAQYGRWSNGNETPVLDGVRPPSAGAGHVGRAGGPTAATLAPPPPANAATTPYPPRGQIRRQKMIYNVKLGEFGVMEGQFTEPSGVAVNARNEIIVADTNNHRIQVFDKEGRFQFSFGECGKREGQLLYPNRVFVNKQSGDIVVTERSPTHQIQIYNQYGAFVRKFGADILQHPRGVTVDVKNRIIVVECKVMRVLIFDYAGEVVKRFGCSRHLEFPNGVAVNDREEIFISDNRAHCVKVFSYEGLFLRKIGGEGITNYPIGVGINQLGQVVIADNHNNFNLTVFSQDGQIVSALESKVKHAQCFDMALMDGGSVVLASKDYRLYVYRYAPVQLQHQIQQYPASFTY